MYVKRTIKFPVFNYALNFSEAAVAVQFVPHGKSSGRVCFQGTAVRHPGMLCSIAGCLTFAGVSKERNAFIQKDLWVL
jgi:hypothetical protein